MRLFRGEEKRHRELNPGNNSPREIKSHLQNGTELLMPFKPWGALFRRT